MSDCVEKGCHFHKSWICMRKKYLGIYISPGMPTKEECRVEQDKKKREDEANNSWAKILDSADAEKRFEE